MKVWRVYFTRIFFQSQCIITIYFLENYASQAVTSSMAASALTTLAEEIFSLLRYLHESKEWTDMINFQIWRYLKDLESETLTIEVSLFHLS